MPSHRTTIASIKESGYSFRVTSDFDDLYYFEEELSDMLREGAYERMKRAQRFVRTEVRITLSRMMSRPSRPNDPPRKVTGDLLRSWILGSRRWTNHKLLLTGKVQSKHPAAGALEFGAIKSLGFGPRPYYRITLTRVADRLGEILEGSDE